MFFRPGDIVGEPRDTCLVGLDSRRPALEGVFQLFDAGALYLVTVDEIFRLLFEAGGGHAAVGRRGLEIVVAALKIVQLGGPGPDIGADLFPALAGLLDLLVDRFPVEITRFPLVQEILEFPRNSFEAIVGLGRLPGEHLCLAFFLGKRSLALFELLL